MRQRDARNWLAFLIGLTLAVGLLVSMAGTAQGQSSRVSLVRMYDQHPTKLVMGDTTFNHLMAGIDTTHTEMAFCLSGYLVQFAGSDTVYAVVDSAFTPKNVIRRHDSVTFTCPAFAPSAHWHVKRLGHAYYPSEVDILGSVDSGAPFQVLVDEDGVAPYMVDERQIRHYAKP